MLVCEGLEELDPISTSETSISGFGHNIQLVACPARTPSPSLGPETESCAHDARICTLGLGTRSLPGQLHLSQI